MLPFTYPLDGRIVEVLHDEAQAHRNDPGRPLPAEITHLTGLTDDDVRAERIDAERAGALIERSGLVVAHNARFDRPFVERVVPAACARPWACTRAEVGWTAEGFASQALHGLLCAYGVYARDRHRALADSEAGVWLLAQRLPVSGEPVLAAMRRRALTETVRLWAIRSAFDTKEVLRARGYRWMPQMRNGIERAWWIEVEPGEEEAELEWLREQVYGGMWHLLPPGGIPRRRVSAFERWREDPADLAQQAPVYPGTPAPVAMQDREARPRGPARTSTGSARVGNPIHRDRLERRHVDSAFIEDRLHPFWGPSDAAPGPVRVLPDRGISRGVCGGCRSKHRPRVRGRCRPA